MREEELIQWIKDNIDASIRVAESKFSHFDAYSEKYDLFIELKCRRKHYPTLMIEKKKFEALTDRGNAIYICSTPKGVFSWDLRKDNAPEWEEKRLPKRTDFGNRSYKNKTVGFLKLSEAKKLD